MARGLVYQGDEALSEKHITFHPTKKSEDKIDELAAKSRLSRAETVRRLIQNALDEKEAGT